MAILAFQLNSINPNRKTKQSRNQSVDIYDWRVIQSCYVRLGTDGYGEGSRIVLSRDCYEVLNLTIPIIYNLNENHQRDYIDMPWFFVNTFTYQPGFCSHCYGSGKVDWVTKTMGQVGMRAGTRMDYRRGRNRFRRDPSGVMLYEKLEKGLPFNTKTLFAYTLLDEGEQYCARCHGTGLFLDGRTRIFASMRGLRHRLMRIKWDAALNLIQDGGQIIDS